MIKLILLFILLLSFQTHAAEVVRIQSGPCDQSKADFFQGILISKNQRTFVVTSDLFVSTLNPESTCHLASRLNEKFELQLVHSDVRQGLALFEVKNAAPALKPLEVATKVERKMKVQWLSIQQEEETPIQVLQTRSQRSFFPKGQDVIEAKATLPSETLGAAALNEAGQLVGMVSKYLLVFQAGSPTRVDRIFPGEEYKAPVILPWSLVDAWIEKTLVSDPGNLKMWRSGLIDKDRYQIEIGKFKIEENCQWAHWPANRPSPIGGFDGYGIGGFDAFEIGGLARRASVCDITIHFDGLDSTSPQWLQDMAKRHPVGSTLNVAGLMRVHSETKNWVLLSAFSLDHFFQMIETEGTSAFYHWQIAPANLRPLEAKASRWAQKLARWADGQHELSREHIENNPMHLYVLNQVRLFNLLLFSTYPEDVPREQWKELESLPEGNPYRDSYRFLMQQYDPNFQDLMQQFEEIWK